MPYKIKLRRYGNYNPITRHYEILSWSIRQCKICGRFLGKFDKVYCNNCGIKRKRIVKKDSNLIQTAVRVYTYKIVRDIVGRIPIIVCKNIGLR